MREIKSIPDRVVERFLSSSRQTVRKVYEAVPLSEAWTGFQILGEMKRQGIGNITIGQVMGTCAVLTGANLIKEVRGQGFIKYPTHSIKAKAQERQQKIEQTTNEEQDTMEQQPMPCANTVANVMRKLPADQIHAALLEIADVVGERVETMTAPTKEHEADLLEARNMWTEWEEKAGEQEEEIKALRYRIAELESGKAEAVRIGEKWGNALTEEKAAHGATRDELHRAQGEIERLSLENAKFAQLKLLLRDGI